MSFTLVSKMLEVGSGSGRIHDWSASWIWIRIRNWGLPYGSADPDPKAMYMGPNYWSFGRFSVPVGHIPRPENASSSREPHKNFFLRWSEASLSPGGWDAWDASWEILDVPVACGFSPLIIPVSVCVQDVTAVANSFFNNNSYGNCSSANKVFPFFRARSAFPTRIRFMGPGRGRSYHPLSLFSRYKWSGFILKCSVPDPWHFGVDPDPRIHASD